MGKSPIERGAGMEPARSLEAGAGALAHEGHPDRNEDAYLKEYDAFGVFDGMGGHGGGDEASHAARDAVRNELKRLPEGLSVGAAAAELARILKSANDRILELQKTGKHPDMGTTATLVKLVRGPEGKRQAAIANVGDSRVYILRKRTGKLEQITLDDGAAARDYHEEDAREIQRRLGAVEDSADLRNLPHVVQNMFANRNQLGAALGMPAEYLQPRTYTVDLEPGDRLLLTSDGIHDNLTDAEMEKIVAGEGSIEEQSEKLAEAAQERSREGGKRSKRDDMTAIVVSYEKTMEGPRKPERAAASPEAKMNEALERQVANAQSIAELVDVIEKRGTYPRSSGGEVTSAKVIEAILAHLDGTIEDEDVITKAGNLRDRVRELKNELERQVAGVKSFDELYQLLRTQGRYPSLEKVVPAESLIKIIEAYRSEDPTNSYSEDFISKSGGLRKRIKELRRAEDLKKGGNLPPTVRPRW